MAMGLAGRREDLLTSATLGRTGVGKGIRVPTGGALLEGMVERNVERVTLIGGGCRGRVRWRLGAWQRRLKHDSPGVVVGGGGAEGHCVRCACVRQNRDGGAGGGMEESFCSSLG